MKIAYYALHYGREWLYWSMKSIFPFVDEIVVLYAERPSYGHKTEIPCPESKQDLMQIVGMFPNTHWYELNRYGHEGSHRDMAVQICMERGAEIIFPIDHDEIWEEEHIERVLRVVQDAPERDFRVSMQHYWRSVHWVCRDPLQPVRVIKPHGHGEKYIDPGLGMMHHFGYAQSPKIVNYKWQIHGHQAELRSGWFNDVFMKWRTAQLDVHPTNNNFWTAAAADTKRLEPYIGDHPYFRVELIDNVLVNELDGIATYPEPISFPGKEIQQKFGKVYR